MQTAFVEDVPIQCFIDLPQVTSHRHQQPSSSLNTYFIVVLAVNWTCLPKPKFDVRDRWMDASKPHTDQFFGHAPRACIQDGDVSFKRGTTPDVVWGLYGQG